MGNTRIRKPSPSTAESESEAAQANQKKRSKPTVAEKQIAKDFRGGRSRQVPSGDVRMTANIRANLHVKLKIVAAERRTTIGELIEELVERNL